MKESPQLKVFEIPMMAHIHILQYEYGSEENNILSICLYVFCINKVITHKTIYSRVMKFCTVLAFMMATKCW